MYFLLSFLCDMITAAKMTPYLLEKIYLIKCVFPLVYQTKQFYLTDGVKQNSMQIALFATVVVTLGPNTL